MRGVVWLIILAAAAFVAWRFLWRKPGGCGCACRKSGGGEGGCAENDESSTCDPDSRRGGTR